MNKQDQGVIAMAHVRGRSRGRAHSTSSGQAPADRFLHAKVRGEVRSPAPATDDWTTIANQPYPVVVDEDASFSGTGSLNSRSNVSSGRSTSVATETIAPSVS